MADIGGDHDLPIYHDELKRGEFPESYHHVAIYHNETTRDAFGEGYEHLLSRRAEFVDHQLDAALGELFHLFVNTRS